MIIIIKLRLTDILDSISRQWVNQKKFVKEKQMRGTYFLIFNYFLFIKAVFSDSDNELDTQTLIEKSKSNNAKPDK